ncbi:MAG TPA: carotenoid 1,2-hydratase, partial [Candidatus Competibacteraceae bacterium]|nr:carotenoid 1,2-hydratase [Candidatus Competibacteraceae bacterium]
ADGLFPLRLRAAEGDIVLDLTLEAGKPLVLQGELGLSRKSAEPGNASYYYSYTRLPTRGVVTVGDQRFPVSGASWLDREWSTSALGPEQEGWDWFALQLDDGRELMFYRLRRKNGTVDPHSSGVLVEADGRYRPLAAEAVAVRPLAYWTSPESGDRYPVRWRLALPAEDLELIVAARLPDQEMRLTVRYWEGAVSVEGRQRERALRGQGYLEMTRYGRRAGGQPAKASTEPSRQP